MGGWRGRLHEIIFEADTPAGRFFDLVLIVLIVASVIAVMLESVASINARYGAVLRATEWAFTIIFTIEYILRLICVVRPARYAMSFFGIVDVLAILPTYLSIFFPGGQALISIRALRLLRIFRVLKLAHHMSEAAVLIDALRNSRRKLTVFMLSVLTLVTILGSCVYLIEGPTHGFTSIPRSVYWAVVTLTTVGYGDIAPQTTLGQAVATIVMILGYAFIAVPTGIVSVELGNVSRRQRVTTTACPHCMAHGHEPDAVYCKFCGGRL
jgi:voltage-gated potassium channel